MFEEGVSEESICKHGRMYLGLYGMGGVGKSTFCEAMCSYFQAEFRGRVCHVELLSEVRSERIARHFLL
jgi:GTPase SAR1 family protein